MYLSQFHLSATDFMHGIIQFYHTINGHLTMVLILVLWLLVSFVQNFATGGAHQSHDFCASTELNHMTPGLTSKRTRPFWAVQALMNVSRFSFGQQAPSQLQSRDEGFAERLEMSWTMIPAMFILAMLRPSMQLLYVSSSMIMSFLGKEYSLDDALDSSFLSPNYTIKVTGNQWYGTYEYGPLHPQGKGFSFESYASSSYDGVSLNPPVLGNPRSEGYVSGSLEGASFPVPSQGVSVEGPGVVGWVETSPTEPVGVQVHMEQTENGLSQLFGHRALSVLQPICFPVGCTVKMLYTSSDVIHSWSVPSLGGKVDAIPGTVNQQVFLVKNLIVQWGQCYELCGAMHYNMPICVVAVPESVFQLWHAVGSKFPS